MTTDEASRLHLYDQARAALGDAAADTLMISLPREPDRAATKDDIGAVKAEIAAQGSDLRGEIATLGSDLRGEIARLDTRITVTEANLRGEIKAGNSELLRTLFFAMITSNATLVGLVLAANRLG